MNSTNKVYVAPTNTEDKEVEDVPRDQNCEESQSSDSSCENDFVFMSYLTSERKRRARKNAALSKNEDEQQISSSESDDKRSEIEMKNLDLLMQNYAGENASISPENATEELNLERLLKSVNSPHKIRSAYTLTFCDLDTDSLTARPTLDCGEQDIAESINLTDQGSVAGTDNSIIENSKKPHALSAVNKSKFWLKCGDFSLDFDINYIDSENLSSLYDIFSKTTCDINDLYIGIDNNNLSVNGFIYNSCMASHIPSSRGRSYYWFSARDCYLVFLGKWLSPKKIARLFRSIYEKTKETGILRFGVDKIEFSNVPEFCNQSPEYNIDSDCNMLATPETGDNNDLERSSRYASPHIRNVIMTGFGLSGTNNFELYFGEHGWEFLKPRRENNTEQPQKQQANSFKTKKVDKKHVSNNLAVSRKVNRISVLDEILDCLYFLLLFYVYFKLFRSSV